MIMDQQELTTTGGMIVFPDIVLANLPREEPIIEQLVIQGTPTSSISLTGSTDQQE